jgi:hypothetical protein
MNKTSDGWERQTSRMHALKFLISLLERIMTARICMGERKKEVRGGTLQSFNQ